MDVVDDHLFRNGIDQTYTNWNKHGETEEPPRSYVYEHNFDMDTSNDVDTTNMNTKMTTDAAETVEMVEAVEENFIGNPDKFRELIEDAEKPLYTGCHNFTKLSAIIQLLKLKSMYGVSDKCFTELLVLIKKTCYQKETKCIVVHMRQKKHLRQWVQGILRYMHVSTIVYFTEKNTQIW